MRIMDKCMFFYYGNSRFVVILIFIIGGGFMTIFLSLMKIFPDSYRTSASRDLPLPYFT